MNSKKFFKRKKKRLLRKKSNETYKNGFKNSFVDSLRKYHYEYNDIVITDTKTRDFFQQKTNKIVIDKEDEYKPSVVELSELKNLLMTSENYLLKASTLPLRNFRTSDVVFNESLIDRLMKHIETQEITKKFIDQNLEKELKNNSTSCDPIPEWKQSNKRIFKPIVK